MKLLLLESSNDIGTAIANALAANYQVELVRTGRQAIQAVLDDSYDIIVLDAHLPDLTALDVCQQLRAKAITAPILVLSADNTVMTKISLLDGGADDYLTKPFPLGELKVRLRALQRRSTQTSLQPPQLTIGDLTLDSRSHTIERAGQSISLRRKEFALLECLMHHAGTVVTRDMLCNYAWHHNEYPWKNTIDVHIKYLRDKIDRPFGQPLIQTVHGLGYKLVALPQHTEVVATVA